MTLYMLDLNGKGLGWNDMLSRDILVGVQFDSFERKSGQKWYHLGN